MHVVDACDGTAEGGLLLHAASMRQLAHGVTENGAMDDSADVSATRYGTTPPETSCVNIWDGYRNRYRARVVGPSDDIRLDCRVCKKGDTTEPSLDFGGPALQTSSP